MRIYPILHRYLFFELIPPFVINTSFFTFIFLMTKILEITNLIVNYRISLVRILLLNVFYMPYFLSFIIPMSVMMSVLLTFLRMSGDNEITALKSSGVGLYNLIFPVILFCVMGSSLTVFMTVYGIPWGNNAVKRLIYEAAASNANVALKERTFNNSFNGVTLYINKIDLRNNTLVDLFIEDRRNEKLISTIVSPKGELINDPETMTFFLRLYNGTINHVDMEKKTVNSVQFQSYALTLDLSVERTVAPNKPTRDEKRMTFGQLLTAIKESPVKDTHYYKYRIELQNKFAIPFACISLGILAVPLGVQSKARRNSYGLGLGLSFFLLYYLMLSMAWVLGETGKYPPEIGVWVPNVVMGIAGVILLKITVNEGPINIFSGAVETVKTRIIDLCNRLSRIPH